MLRSLRMERGWEEAPACTGLPWSHLAAPPMQPEQFEANCPNHHPQCPSSETLALSPTGRALPKSDKQRYFGAICCPSLAEACALTYAPRSGKKHQLWTGIFLQDKAGSKQHERAGKKCSFPVFSVSWGAPVTFLVPGTTATDQ